jgi:hypothetical protein
MRYIHSIESSPEDGTIVFTAVPGLANLIHRAPSAQFDFTYDLPKGEWKEWEVVVFDEKLGCRKCYSLLSDTVAHVVLGVTIARIYAKHEKRTTFHKIWRGFFRMIKDITGKPLKIHFIHGEGLCLMLMDGSGTQVGGLGDQLIDICDIDGSLYRGKNPDEVVAHLVRLCLTHIDR